MLSTTFSIYADRPWLVYPMPKVVADLFSKTRAYDIPDGEEYPFGIHPKVHLIEKGLIATYVQSGSLDLRMTGLFGPGSILGAAKAMTHPTRTMKLYAKTLAPCRIRTLSTRTFLHDLQTYQLENIVQDTVSKSHECQMDGLLVNDLLCVKDRLALLLKILFDLQNTPLNNHLQRLQFSISVHEMANMVHATRAVISRQLSAWVQEGKAQKMGRHWFFHQGILNNLSYTS